MIHDLESDFILFPSLRTELMIHDLDKLDDVQAQAQHEQWSYHD